MSNIRYAQELDTYFGGPKYLYLYRDGRDVALSSTKAVIGDKHPYVIAQKLAELQRLCLNAHALTPERVFSLCYEELIADPAHVLSQLCRFLGIELTDTMLAAHTSTEATRTAQSSSLWSNLIQPILRNNRQKFLKELCEEDLRIIESVADDCLDALGYECVYVQPGEARRFSEKQIAEFQAQNRELIYHHHKATEPEDRVRRQIQQQVLDEVKARLWAYHQTFPLIPPYGEQLVDLMVPAEAQKEVKAHASHLPEWGTRTAGGGGDSGGNISPAASARPVSGSRG
jgi:hypothetical protein